MFPRFSYCVPLTWKELPQASGTYFSSSNFTALHFCLLTLALDLLISQIKAFAAKDFVKSELG